MGLLILHLMGLVMLFPGQSIAVCAAAVVCLVGVAIWAGRGEPR
jgi:hypothetical protein